MEPLVIHRLSGGSRLVIDDPTALAAVYFGPGLVGSRFAPYDEAAAADTHSDQITDDDISVINRTFGARSPHKEWVRFTNDRKPLKALEAIGHDWSLLEMSQADSPVASATFSARSVARTETRPSCRRCSTSSAPR